MPSLIEPERVWIELPGKRTLVVYGYDIGISLPLFTIPMAEKVLKAYKLDYAYCDANGRLVHKTPKGKLLEESPVVMQMPDSGRPINAYPLYDVLQWKSEEEDEEEDDE